MSKKTQITYKLINMFLKRSSIKEGLKYLLELDSLLYKLEGVWSVKYGNGIHSKHRHIRYDQYFIKNIKPGDSVLDIGCGNGFLDYQIINRVKVGKLTGIDISKESIQFAKEHYKSPNLQFIQGNALKKFPDGKFDVIILSNVIEHIEERVGFLKDIISKIQPKRFLIRVPMFERDWRVPLKRELDINYLLDPTHYIEYTKEEFIIEMKRAGLKPVLLDVKWGEIWSELISEKTGNEHEKS